MAVQRGFGRLRAPDPDDALFPMRAARRLEPKISDLPARYFYRRGPILEQGSTGTCVGHGWRAWLSGEPLMTEGGPSAFDIYDGSLPLDEWAQNDHDTARLYGTSVRAGAKFLSSLGHVQSYVWATSVDDIIRWILGGFGGVVLGTQWLDQMNVPTSEGIIRARGKSEGGHCYYGYGLDRMRGLIAIQNSWGVDWGGWPEEVYENHAVKKVVRNNGCALLPLDDLARLLKQCGEVCTAVEHCVEPVVPAL
jgi:hypothetical protein